MVALIMTDNALNSLMSTSFKLGGEVSVAAGPVGAGTGAPITADMVVYTRSKGLYGGINLDGTVITIDEERNRAYYGQAATPVDILVTRSVANPYSAPLAQTASGAGAGRP
jgi:lipid-binding SYLF domain-containing protein